MALSHHDVRLRRFTAAGLYVVTSSELSKRPTLEIIDAVLKAGVSLIQLREKSCSTAELMQLARQARTLTARYDALLIINDRLDVAMACAADGVHLGQNDFPVSDARRLAPKLLIGASSHDVDEAREAEAAGASYVNIGPLFPTTTKEWKGAYLGMDGLKAIAAQVSIPFSVMGGIKRQHIPGLVSAGAHVIALVTAVTQADDPGQEAAELLQLIRGGRGGTAAPERG